MMNGSTASGHRFSAYDHADITQRNQNNSPLLRLPAELRNRIYEFAFDAATLRRDLSPTSAGRYFVVPDTPRLTLVCRQIHFETRPFRGNRTYRRLTVRMEGRHIADLVDWVGQAQCAQIIQIDMFQSLAGAIRPRVKEASPQGQYNGLWDASGEQIFSSLKRVVVTYPITLADDAVEIGESLQTLFGNPDLDVQFRGA
ncbi:hypothetical protein C7974DRAFT_470275, partial [Boeremia exigua]|uniref:uncharacterized protein n=1 Tax=Boeremia exigua TaxID=749465 RepID=UPI001E8DF1DA